MEEVAPPGVFLSFTHPGGEVIAQMEREGKAVRSLSAVLTVRRKALAGEIRGDLRRLLQPGLFRESAGLSAVLTSCRWRAKQTRSWLRGAFFKTL